MKRHCHLFPRVIIQLTSVKHTRDDTHAPSSLDFDHDYSYSEKILPRYYVRTSCHRKIRDNSLIMSLE